MPNQLDEYVTRAATAGQSMWLGRLLYYTIAEDTHVDHSEFCRLLLNNGIDTVLPPQPQPADVFVRACAAVVSKKRQPSDTPGVFVNYLMRDSGSSPKLIWRVLVEERVDTDDHTLSYEEAATFHYDRTAAAMSVSVNENATPQAAKMSTKVEQLFHEWNNMLTAYALRTLLRKLLDDMNAILVRPSGGLYFVNEDNAERIDHLEQIINDLPDCVFHTIPLVDDRKQRTMLKQAFEADSIGEIDRLLGEMAGLLKTGTKITSSRMADFKVEHDRLRRKANDYAAMLSEAMDQTVSRLDIMQEVLFELLGLVKV